MLKTEKIILAMFLASLFLSVLLFFIIVINKKSNTAKEKNLNSVKPYVLREGNLSPDDSNYDGAYPNYNKGYAYIDFMALSKNPTFSSAMFQSTPNGSPYFSNTNDYGNEPLKISWTNGGVNYGEGDLTLEGNAIITANFDNNPITIYLPKIPLCTEKTHPNMDLLNPKCWRRTDRKSSFECPDKWNFDGICANYEGAHYLYVACDGSTYWDANLTKLARSAPPGSFCVEP